MFDHAQALEQKNVAFSVFSKTDGHTAILTCTPKNSILLLLNEILISFGWAFYQLDLKEDWDKRIDERYRENIEGKVTRKIGKEDRQERWIGKKKGKERRRRLEKRIDKRGTT